MGMLFYDRAVLDTFNGELRPETSPSGHPVLVLFLTPRKGGEARRIAPGQEERLALVEGTQDDIARLDRAGYFVGVALRSRIRRNGQRRRRRGG